MSIGMFCILYTMLLLSMDVHEYEYYEECHGISLSHHRNAPKTFVRTKKKEKTTAARARHVINTAYCVTAHALKLKQAPFLFT